MKKSDLKNFDVVTLRNGEVFLVAKDKNVIVNRNDINHLAFFKEDLTHGTEKRRDIVAVHRADMDTYLMFDCLTNMPVIWKREEKIELTQPERAILEIALTKGYFFVARDLDKDLYFFGSKPRKYPDGLWRSYDDYCARLPAFLNDLFQFVKWEQEEAMSIKELLENESMER